jgi:hypothetical protein
MKLSLSAIVFFILVVFLVEGSIISLNSKILSTLPQYNLILSGNELFSMPIEAKCSLGTIMKSTMGSSNTLDMRIAVDRVKQISECQLVFRYVGQPDFLVFLSYDPKIDQPLTYNIYEAEPDS